MDVILLALGVALAGAGGELFVRGAVGLATRLRIPAGVVGATVAAFATSAPELSVAVQSAADGRSELAVGDALGSNVANVGLVLAVAALLAPLRHSAGTARRELPVALAAPLLTALLVADGTLSRADGALLLVVFATWLAVVVRASRRARSAAPAVLGEAPAGRAAPAAALGGLVLLAVAGAVVVEAAGGIGEALGLDPYVVGATLVALGTSTPELATTIVARRRGHDDIGLGTILGSNIFNNLWIVGVAVVVSPAEVDLGEVALAVAAGVAVVLLAIPDRAGVLTRRRGALLLATYLGYVVGALVLR